MYMIIYWDSKGLHVLQTGLPGETKNTIKLFNSINEAYSFYRPIMWFEQPLEIRVISIEGVHE